MTKSINSGDYTLTVGATISPYDNSRFVATVTVVRYVDGRMPEFSKHIASVQARPSRSSAIAHGTDILAKPDMVKKLVDKHIARYHDGVEQKEPN